MWAFLGLFANMDTLDDCPAYSSDGGWDEAGSGLAASYQYDFYVSSVAWLAQTEFNRPCCESHAYSELHNDATASC